MHSKLAAAIILVILCFTLFSSLDLNLAKTQNTIYIRADGSIEGTNKIHRDGDIYTLIDNINGSLVVERDNIVVDGADFTLSGEGGIECVGVNISSRKNVTIKDMTIKGGLNTVLIFNSSHCNILDNNIRGSRPLEFYYPRRIYLNNSYNNLISGNDGAKVSLSASHGNILAGNDAGIKLLDSSHNTIKNNDIGLGAALDVASIVLHSSSNNIISGCNSTVKLRKSNHNVICGNNGFIGLWERASNNNITQNEGNILVMESNNNTVTQNVVKNHSHGIQLGYSSGNTFSGNVIRDNRVGVLLVPDVSNNTFYHNNFVNNTQHVELRDDSVAFWDDGAEGNYWKDYLKRYPYAQELNDLDIWDTPYVIDENNKDNYPLIDPVDIETLPQPTEYTLTVDMEGEGTTDPPSGTYIFEEGEEVVVEAIAGGGWEFDGWVGDVVGEADVIFVVMDGDKTVTANFVQESLLDPDPSDSKPQSDVVRNVVMVAIALAAVTAVALLLRGALRQNKKLKPKTTFAHNCLRGKKH